MNLVIMLLVSMAAALLQMLVPVLNWAGQARLLALVAVVVYYALYRETHVALCGAFVAGLTHDMLSPVPLGFSSFLFIVLTFLTGRIRHLVHPDAVITGVFWGGVITLLYTLGLYLLLSLGNHVSWPWSMVWVKAFWQALLVALVTPWVCMLCRRLDGWVGNTEEREAFYA